MIIKLVKKASILFAFNSILFLAFQSSNSLYVIKNLDNQKKWYEVTVKNTGTIKLPNTLELQEGTYQKIVHGLNKILGYEVSDLVAQNKGCNDFTPDCSKRYARVMLKTDIAEVGYFDNLDFDIDIISKDEMKEIGQAYKNMISNRMSSAPDNQKAELIKWYNPIFEKINNKSCLHLKYTRQLNEAPVVLVNTYIFYNNDRIHSLTLSYRQNQSSYWEKDFEQILNSLSINKID